MSSEKQQFLLFKQNISCWIRPRLTLEHLLPVPFPGEQNMNNVHIFLEPYTATFTDIINVKTAVKLDFCQFWPFSVFCLQVVLSTLYLALKALTYVIQSYLSFIWTNYLQRLERQHLHQLVTKVAEITVIRGNTLAALHTWNITWHNF